jgi:hypothetical protein
MVVCFFALDLSAAHAVFVCTLPAQAFRVACCPSSCWGVRFIQVAHLGVSACTGGHTGLQLAQEPWKTFCVV